MSIGSQLQGSVPPALNLSSLKTLVKPDLVMSIAASFHKHTGLVVCDAAASGAPPWTPINKALLLIDSQSLLVLLACFFNPLRMERANGFRTFTVWLRVDASEIG